MSKSIMFGEPENFLSHDLGRGISQDDYDTFSGGRDQGMERPYAEKYTTSPGILGYAADLEAAAFGGEPEKTARQCENAAFVLLREHLGFGDYSDEITDDLMTVAQLYALGGVDALINNYPKQRNETLEFIDRLRKKLVTTLRGRSSKYDPDVSQSAKENLQNKKGYEFKALYNTIFK